MRPNQLIDPTELARISNLELLARTVVEGLGTGIHRSPQTGTSIEFAQYRPYAQGDDLRFLDWKLFGRSDRLHLKQFQDETNLTCTVMLDCSASMAYGSGSITKFDYARMLAASIATILNKQGDRCGLVAYHREIVCHLPPRGDRSALRRLIVTLDGLDAAETTDTSGALHFLGDIIKPRGMVILIADLLHPLDVVLGHLKSLRARRHDVLVLQICDPAERDFPFDRSVTLQDLEAELEQFVVPSAVREGYLENRRQHFETIRRECLAAEIDLAEFSCDQPLDFALRHFLRRRVRALKTSGLIRSHGGATA